MGEEKENKIAKLEALLFIHGEPLTLKKAAEVLGVEKDEMSPIVEELKKRLDSEYRGLALVSGGLPAQAGEKIQLVTKPQFGKILEDFVKEELSEDLTPASLEALAIVAYFGPISRARIDYVRGVNSIFILRSLLLRGLVERIPYPDRRNTFLYNATFEAWRHLGLKGKEDLPDFEKFQELLAAFEKQEDVKSDEIPPVAYEIKQETKSEEQQI